MDGDPARPLTRQVVVVSQGAHFITEEATFVQHMGRVAELLRARTSRGTLVLFHDSVPGVADCDTRQFARPLETLEEAERLVFDKAFYDGPSFKRRNELAAGVFGAAGFVHLHTYLPTVLRQDSRLGYRVRPSSQGGARFLDCIHFCVPGPTLLWADMLAQRVVQASECARQIEII